MADNPTGPTGPAPNPQDPTASATSNTPSPTFNFQPNALDSSANYTYHIRWSMCTEADSNSLILSGGASQFRNGVNKVIIAESGVTVGYNIVDLTIISILAGSPTTPQSNALTMEMTVVEPYGLTLPDNLFVASKNIGIQNYLLSSCQFLEIWFKGYNEDGSPNGSLDQIYKLWSVKINKLESKTTESGTTYKIEMLANNEYNKADHVECLTDGLNFKASNISEFFKQLSQKWTDQNKSLYEDKIARIEYEIRAPFAEKWAFDKNPTTSQAQNSMTIGEGGIGTFQLGRGQDLTSIINFVLSMTKEGQNFAVGNSSGRTSNTGLTNLVVIHAWNYPTSTSIDPKTNDYRRKVIYTLLAYPTTRAVGTLANAATTSPTARSAALAASKNFVKHYYWTYTGQNLDVSKFELTINYTKQTPIINQLGWNTIANYRVGPQLNANGIGVATQNNLSTTTPSNVPAGQTASPNLNNTVTLNQSTQQNAAAVNSATAAASQSTATPSPNGNNPSVATQAAANGLANTTQSPQAQSQPGVLPQQPPISLRQTQYLEDVGTNVYQIDPWVISGRATVAPINQNTGQGGDGPQQNKTNDLSAKKLNPSRPLISSILDEVAGEGLANQKLTIRGDPYWLGFGNIDENKLVGNGNQSPPNGRENNAWFLNGDNGYVFTLRTGTTYNETTGLMDLGNNTTMWNGLWKVNKITHHFKDGMFSQDLESMRDTLSSSPPASQSSTLLGMAENYLANTAIVKAANKVATGIGEQMIENAKLGIPTLSGF